MTPAIFSSPAAARAVVTLVLIENSQRMHQAWPDLRQHVLPTLLGTLRIANPVLPITVLWLTTAPVGDDPASPHAAPPRQYNQLPELKFSFSPDNKITSRIINRATELMLDAAAQFHGGPVVFHLFVVAASPPSPGTWGVSLTMPSQIGQSEWRLLSERIAQLGIHCHMILPAAQDMYPMHELFSTTLDLQGHTQVAPWFPTSPDYTFLLSGDPAVPNSSARAHSLSRVAPPDPAALDPVDQHPLPAVVRPPVLRHQSFPQDTQSAPAPPPAQNDSTPSLVTSLQKVHGLSRKKLYGTQPPRQPFVREEPVRAKYKSTPTPLSIPVGSQPFPASDDGRPVGKAKVERGRRADRPPHIGDVSTSISPGRRSPWSRLSSSDVGSPPSSPTTSMSSHHTTSPTIPLYPDLGFSPSTSPGFSPSMVSPVSMPDMSFSTLHDPSGEYFSMSPPLTAVPGHSRGAPWTPVSKPVPNPALMTKPAGTPSSGRRHSQELVHGSHVQSLSAMSSKYRLDSLSAESRPTPKNTQKVKDAGDVPFIFSPELEAATAAKLKAALQSTSPVNMSQFSAFTSGNNPNYAVTSDTYPSSQAPLGYTVLLDACPTMDHASMNGDGIPPHVVRGASSSSLQGWAG